jgi:hypothetical protein
MQFSETERTNNLEIETLRTNYADELETLRTQFADVQSRNKQLHKMEKAKNSKIKTLRM